MLSTGRLKTFSILMTTPCAATAGTLVEKDSNLKYSLAPGAGRV